MIWLVLAVLLAILFVFPSASGPEVHGMTIAGAPTDGVNEVQRITPTPPITSGTFTLSWNGQTTAAIAFNATAADIQAALRLLSNIGNDNVQCSGGPVNAFFVNVTFQHELGGFDQAAMTVDNGGLGGGGSLAISTPTAGVQGSYRGSGKGSTLYDTTNKKVYRNTGDKWRQVWTEVT